MPYSSLFVIAVLTGSMLAQEPTKSKRSMADGLVRQLIERKKLQPIRLESGLEMGQGKGPMVLMIWRADGSMSLHKLQRGYDDFGPAAKKQGVPLEEEAEEEEAVEEEAVEEEVEEEVEAGQKKAGANADGGPGAAASQPNLSVKLSRKGDTLLIEVPGVGSIEGAEVDRARLQLALQQQFARIADPKLRRSPFLIEPQSEVLMRDVLTTWEVARTAGFHVFFGGGRIQGAALNPEMQEKLASLPVTFDWPVKKVNVLGTPQAICEGELLILLDGECRWSRFLPLLMKCAKIGIWQIGIVGQKDASTRFKLPTHLPFDKGLIK